MMTWFVRAVLVAILGLVLSTPALARECGDVRVPERVKVDGDTLVLNGMGIREATAFKVDVYVAGLYLPSRSGNPSQILQSADQKKRLVLKFVRDVDQDDITEAFEEGIRATAGGAKGKVAAGLRQLNGWMTDMPEGGSLTFTYLPGKGLEVRVDHGRRGVIEGAEFARAFFAIWLGGSPPNAGLKRGLLGGRCG